ncbi:Globin domain-containing protein [Caenorhabditis elegans]|uniref:Globin domain-containing protein n=1 Tax=Caenorhabditis elegans TaxID=6239 RepID=O17824_CAEEL|nr:Globin family profile domain-containing protein [Caenorhabditis elegans]CAB04152.2 Globin family profile domain-containing protein [Caenorhabditis elegans]|eukprot:NP_506867.2 GLoBin related [Caenorhabditis elegans]
MYRQLIEQHIEEVNVQRDARPQNSLKEPTIIEHKEQKKSSEKPVTIIVEKPAKVAEKPKTTSSEKENAVPVDPLARKIIDETSRLSDRQRDVLQKTFAPILQDCVRNGLKIFVRLFSEYPRYKLIWPQFRAIPDSSLMNAVELRRHASVYLNGLGKIIDSMRDEEALGKSMSRIAVAHIKWNVQRNHVIHMIEPVLEVVKECNGYQLDDETRQAWTVLYQVIADLIEVFRCRALND